MTTPINGSGSENLATFSLFQGSIPAAPRSGKSSRGSLSQTGLIGGTMGGGDVPDVVGMTRIQAINALTEAGVIYMLTYTASNANGQNNDTIASMSVVDGVAYITAYQYTAPVYNAFLDYQYTMSMTRAYEIYFGEGQTVPADNSIIRIVGATVSSFNQTFLVKNPQPTSSSMYPPVGFTTAMELVPLEGSVGGGDAYGQANFYSPPRSAQGWEAVDAQLNPLDVFTVEDPLGNYQLKPFMYIENGNIQPSDQKVVSLIGTNGFDGQYYVESHTESMTPSSPSTLAQKYVIKSFNTNAMYMMTATSFGGFWVYAQDDYSWSFNGDWNTRTSQDLDDWTITGDAATDRLVLSVKAGMMNNMQFPMYYKLMSNTVKPINNGYAGKQMQLTGLTTIYESPNVVAPDGIYNVSGSTQWIGNDGMGDTYNIDVFIDVPHEVALAFSGVYQYGAQIQGLVTLIP